MANNNASNMVVMLGGMDVEMQEIQDVANKAGLEVINKGLKWNDHPSASDFQEEVAQAISEGKKIVFIEVRPDIDLPVETIVIDHHDENAGKPASILQFLSLLGQKPTYHQKLIAANDDSFIPGMLKLGASEAEILEIRRLDWEAQGITPEQISEAQRAVADHQNINGVDVVRMAHSKCAPVTDMLFRPNQLQNVLCICGDGECDYYGSAKLCRLLRGKKIGQQPAPWDSSIMIDTYDNFGGWIGGATVMEEDGQFCFWGGYGDQNSILEFVTNYFAQK